MKIIEDGEGKLIVKRIIQSKGDVAGSHHDYGLDARLSYSDSEAIGKLSRIAHRAHPGVASELARDVALVEVEQGRPIGDVREFDRCPIKCHSIS